MPRLARERGMLSRVIGLIRDDERALAELTDMVCRYLVEDERK
jgi:hypothetical protein